MPSINRKRLQRFLDGAGDALRQLLDEVPGQEDHHREYSDLAAEADDLLELIEQDADLEGSLDS